jgi:hypothetical protein
MDGSTTLSVTLKPRFPLLKQGAPTVSIPREKTVPQGLKPDRILTRYGPTEVVP